MVSAGPGTGKTECLAARVAYLIHSQECTSDEILVLTPTERSAGRIKMLVEENTPIGDIPVDIQGFSGFIIRSLSQYSSSAIVAQSPSGVRSMYEKHENELGLEIFHSKKSFFSQRSVLTYFNLLDNLNVSAEQYLAYVDELRRELAANADGNKMNLEHTRQFVAIHDELSRARSKFEAVRTQRSTPSVGDLAASLLEMLAKQPAFSDYLQSRYRHILVDNVHDLAVVQFRILERLVGRASGFFLAGDEDQSHHSWKGVKTKVFEALTRTLELHGLPFERHALTYSFRHSAPLLDAAKKLLSNNSLAAVLPGLLPRTAITAQFNNAHFQPALALGVSERAFESVEAETLGIIDLIRDIRDVDRESSIGILVHTHAYAKNLLRLLKTKGVYSVSYSTPFAASPLINLLVNWLVVLARPHGAFVAEILNRQRDTKVSLYQRLEKLTESGDESNVRALTRFLSDVELYRRKLAEEPVLVVLSSLVQSHSFFKGIKNPKTSQEEEQAEEIARLIKLVQKLESRRLPETDAASFIVSLQRLIDLGEVDSLNPLDTSAEPGLVQIANYYTASTMEIDYVIMTGFTEQKFPGFLRRTDLSVPAALSPEPLHDRKHHVEEMRRLVRYRGCQYARLMRQAYSSVTRAKKLAICTYPLLSASQTKSESPSRFIAELFGVPKKMRRSQVVQPLEEEPVPVKATVAPSKTPEGAIDLSSRAAVLQSITLPQLMDYLRCPVEFGLRHLLQTSGKLTVSKVFPKAGQDQLLMSLKTGDYVSNKHLASAFLEAWKLHGFDEAKIPTDYYGPGVALLETVLAESDALPPLVHLNIPAFINLGALKLEVALHQIYEEALKNRSVRIVLRQFVPHFPADFTQKKWKFIAEVLALAYQKRFNRLPTGVVIDYVKKKDLLSLSFAPTEADVASVASALELIAASIKSGLYESHHTASLCRFCDFRNSCPQSLALAANNS